MRRIADHDVKGKKILLRVDLNSPVKDGMIAGSERIKAHAKTINEISERGAAVIVLAHQGKKGSPDFLHLEQHARMLHRILGKDVAYVDDVVGSEAKKAITRMKPGDILVLDNVRLLECENTTDGKIVEGLSPLVDYFVLDALSVAHRKHSSVMGFFKKIPCFAGDILSAEIDAMKNVRSSRDVTFFLGGSKVSDSFRIMENWLQDGRARIVLVGGALSVLLLYAKGFNIGGSREFLENSDLLDDVDKARKILEKYDGKIMLPADVGLSVDMKRVECDADKITEGQVWDIGGKTIEEYRRVIYNSKCVVMNGPAGVYELEDFSKGTRAVLEAIARSDAYSLLGGGHTINAINLFGMKKEHFSYISLSGKAMIEFLCGNELPGITALDENEKLFKF